MVSMRNTFRISVGICPARLAVRGGMLAETSLRRG